MIPPGLIIKAGQLVAPVAAKLASPFVKWGIIAGIVVGLMVGTWWKTYDAMRTACEEDKLIAVQAASAAAAEESRRQLTQTIALNEQISAERDQKSRELEEFVESVRKKARKYAAVKIDVPADIVRLHDQYAGMSLQPQHQASPQGADNSAGRTEVQRGEIPAQTEQRVRVDLGYGETVEMTLENAILMLSDTYKTLQAALRDYEKFSEWNDGREAIELGQAMERKE